MAIWWSLSTKVAGGSSSRAAPRSRERFAWRPPSCRTALVWAGLALAGPSLASAGSAGAGTPITDDGVSVWIARGGAVSVASGRVEAVGLRIEVVDDEMASERGFRSMASVVDIDCRAERDRVRSALAFERPHLSGRSQPRPVSGEWVRPTPEAYLAKVIKQVCANERLGRQPAAPVATAAAAVAAAPPAPSHEAARSQAVSISAPPPKGPTVGFIADAPPSRVQAFDAERPGVGPAQLRVQLASSPSHRAAQQVLDGVAAAIRPPLAAEVAVTNVGGKTVYRSIVSNFGSVADAQTFCFEMTANGRGCFVWTGRSGAIQ